MPNQPKVHVSRHGSIDIRSGGGGPIATSASSSLERDVRGMMSSLSTGASAASGASVAGITSLSSSARAGAALGPYAGTTSALAVGSFPSVSAGYPGALVGISPVTQLVKVVDPVSEIVKWRLHDKLMSEAQLGKEVEHQKTQLAVLQNRLRDRELQQSQLMGKHLQAQETLERLRLELADTEGRNIDEIRTTAAAEGSRRALQGRLGVKNAAEVALTSQLDQATTQLTLLGSEVARATAESRNLQEQCGRYVSSIQKLDAALGVTEASRTSALTATKAAQDSLRDELTQRSVEIERLAGSARKQAGTARSIRNKLNASAEIQVQTIAHYDTLIGQQKDISMQLRDEIEGHKQTEAELLGAYQATEGRTNELSLHLAAKRSDADKWSKFIAAQKVDESHLKALLTTKSEDTNLLQQKVAGSQAETRGLKSTLEQSRDNLHKQRRLVDKQEKLHSELNTQLQSRQEASMRLAQSLEANAFQMQLVQQSYDSSIANTDMLKKKLRAHHDQEQLLERKQETVVTQLAAVKAAISEERVMSTQIREQIETLRSRMEDEAHAAKLLVDKMDAQRQDALRQLDALTQALAATEAQATSLSAQLVDFRESATALYMSQEQRLREVEDVAARLRDSLAEMSKEALAKEAEMEVEEAKLNSLSAQLEAREQEVTELNRQLAVVAGGLEDTNKVLARCTAEVEELNIALSASKLRKAELEVALKSVEDERTVVKGDIRLQKQASAQLRTSLKDAAARELEQVSTLVRVIKDLEMCETNRKDAVSAFERLSELLATAQTRNKQLTRDVNEATAAEAELAATLGAMQDQQVGLKATFDAKEDELADLTHAAKVERQTLQNDLMAKQTAVESAEINLAELESDKRTYISELQQAELRAEETQLTHERRMASLDAQTEVLSQELADREMHEEQMREMHAAHEAQATVLTGRFDELTSENAMREEQMGNLKTQLASLETEKDVKVSEQGKLRALLQESENEETRLTGQKDHSLQVEAQLLDSINARQGAQKRLTSALEDKVHEEKVLTSKLATRQSSVRNYKDSVDKETEANRLAEAQLDAERANVTRLREDLAVTKDTKDRMMEELTLRLRSYEDWKIKEEQQVADLKKSLEMTESSRVKLASVLLRVMKREGVEMTAATTPLLTTMAGGK